MHSSSSQYSPEPWDRQHEVVLQLFATWNLREDQCLEAELRHLQPEQLSHYSDAGSIISFNRSYALLCKRAGHRAANKTGMVPVLWEFIVPRKRQIGLVHN